MLQWRNMKILVLILAIFSTSLSFAASIDPHVHWRSLQTPHFEVIYDRNQKELADTYAVAAEQAYQILSARFSELPNKTYLVLTDITDQANGGATFIPYPIINVYPVLPDSVTSLDYYGNWPLEMMVHEYTHILTFQPRHGFYTPLKYVFGSVIHPNGILPRWYLEGLAVESESRFTDFGRLKSPHTSAELRAISQDGKLQGETIDRINETIIPTYPYGERPYLFGSILWEHMLETGPKDVVEALNQSYGRRLPFLLNAPAEDVFHRNYPELLRETYQNIETEVAAQIKNIESRGRESVHYFKDDGMEQIAPAISPDGSKLIYLTSSMRIGQIRMLERTGNESFSTCLSKKLLDTGAGESLRASWLPNSAGFVFDNMDEMDHYHSFRSLYEYSLKDQSIHQLVSGLRAQDPAVSPDGKLVAYISNENSRTQLGLLDRETLAPRVLFRPGLYQRLSHPEFISKFEIAFTARNLRGEEKLYVYNLATKKFALHFPKHKEIRNPKLTSLGLLVASSESGVKNITVGNLKTQTVEAITNTTTEIQFADYDNRTKELVVSRQTGNGRKLASTNIQQVELAKVGPVVTTKWPPPPEIPPMLRSDFKDENYQPIEYLWPRYWIPFLYPVYNGVYFQGATEQHDPAGINRYALSAAYDTVTKRGSYGIQYVNASLPPDIELSYIKSEQYLGASGFVLDTQSAGGNLAFYLPGMSKHWKATTGYTGDRINTPFGKNYNRQGPLASLFYSTWDDPRSEGAGTIVGLSHQEFLSGSDQLHYGRSSLTLEQAWHLGLPKGHRIVTQTRVALAPKLPFSSLLSLGDSSLGANYLVSLSNSMFLFRGYPSGTFVGRKTLNANFEYQFPLSTSTFGFGTKPLFVRGWDAAFFVDAIAVDGASYDSQLSIYRRRTLGEFALGTGFEAKWNTTVAYEMPLTWILGLYFGFDDKAQNAVMPFLGIAASDLSTIDHLRKNWFKH
jgi:Tol biopolymer transport system component